MHRAFIIMVIAVTLLPVGRASQAAGEIAFTDVVVLGDSLSDNGNLYALTDNFIPVSPPYWHGRFSNGPVWVELLAPMLGVNAHAMTNLAVGGHTTDAIVDHQLAPLLEAGPTDPGALHVVWGGANDFLSKVDEQDFKLDATVQTAVDNIMIAINALYDAGAQSFLVPNLPDISHTPRYIDDPDADLAHAYSVAFNDLLADQLAFIAASRDHMTLYTLDVFGFMNDIIDDPQAFGLVNVSDRVLLNNGTTIGDPDQYLFWDDLHPTAIAHEMLADAALQVIPAPPTLPLLLITALALQSHRRRGESRARFDNQPLFTDNRRPTTDHHQSLTETPQCACS